ncbi:MAG: hypothetical protein RDU24_05820 [Humidesulfovibrio sp.]|uniref:hypothetical protein n=1 Tax=Humidesulfovibrio sp. TaxID=2910988 RepID=UPI0027EC200B|nr:hypothetical protein [Humidesulfovibrio sp.]MDQ7834880.1 hypothetical protein [Humidesulfovibrio sp.]
MSVGDRPVLCLCRGLTREGVLLSLEAGARSLGEVRGFCEANGHVVAPAPDAMHDCCTDVLAGLLRQAQQTPSIES